MIKRRFYQLEHGDGDSASSSSSSDSEEFEPEEGGGEQEENDQRVDGEEEEEEEKDGRKPASETPSARSFSSGYESDSSGYEINCDSTGLLGTDCEKDSGKDWQNFKDNQAHDCHPEENKRFASNSMTKTVNSEDSLQAEMSECILKCKSVFKCRICPRIVCLSEDTLLTHLKSKRHARSRKLLGEGRLKLMLNSDGEIEKEEEEETHAERHARTVAERHAQTVALLQPTKKNKGRQRQSKRRKMKARGCGGSKSSPPQNKTKDAK